MSQATDLLNSLTDDQISAYSSNAGEEPHIVIGDDRFIKVPESLKRIAVQYDHNVETVTFDCPRYWDDLDMSEMIVYINYLLPNKEKAAYIAENVAADGDIMHFTWTISSEVTRNQGQIAFLVCVKKTGENEDGDPIEINHWNSELCTDCYISEGMECDVVLDMEYPDIVTQLLERMTVVERAESQMKVYLADAESAKSGAQTAASEAAANATVSLEAKDEVLEASAEIRNSYANAIKGNVSGEIIKVDDVSPLEHDVKCVVHGKNLFDSSDNTTEKDYSTGEQVYGFSVKHLVIGREYTVFSEEPMRWFKISNSLTGYSCAGLSNLTTGFTSYTFTHFRNPNIPDSEELHIYVGNLDRTADTDLDALNAMKICIVEGPVATTYEPYINAEGKLVTICGKNLAPTTDFTLTGTVMKYGAIGDFSGSLLVKNIPIKPGMSYAVSAILPTQITSLTAFLYNGTLSDSVKHHNGCYTTVFSSGRGTQIQLTDGKVTNTGNYEYMAITSGNVSDYTEGSTQTIHVKKLQIESGDKITPFEAYKGTEGVVVDSKVSLKSVSPIMTVFSNTPGLLVEAEYNRDTTKMFESYVLTDEAKSQIAKEIEDDMAEVLAALNSYAASLTGGGN